MRKQGADEKGPESKKRSGEKRNAIGGVEGKKGTNGQGVAKGTGNLAGEVNSRKKIRELRGEGERRAAFVPKKAGKI